MLRKHRATDAEVRALHERFLAGEDPEALAKEAGYKNKGVLCSAFRRLGLPTPRQLRLERARREAIPRWDAGEGLVALAKEYRVGADTLAKWLREAGREPNRTGPDHPRWKGARRMDHNGYIRLRVFADNPYFEMARDRSKTSGVIPEHRLVMAEHLGRCLKRSETVHHKNGVKTDNRIENLQLRQGHHGPGAAWECAACGSHHVRAVKI